MDQRNNVLYSRVKNCRFERTGVGKDRLVLGRWRTARISSTVKEGAVPNDVQHVQDFDRKFPERFGVSGGFGLPWRPVSKEFKVPPRMKPNLKQGTDSESIRNVAVGKSNRWKTHHSAERVAATEKGLDKLGCLEAVPEKFAVDTLGVAKSLQA